MPQYVHKFPAQLLLAPLGAELAEDGLFLGIRHIRSRGGDRCVQHPGFLERSDRFGPGLCRRLRLIENARIEFGDRESA